MKKNNMYFGDAELFINSNKLNENKQRPLILK